ncbi:MAG: tyrosine-type recombinase/integrase [Clostridia bacterium]|nr:tyrosine-type recombinase/integrase [Clostridia bacterium]
MNDHIGQYEQYLKNGKKLSRNTLEAYRRDVKQFCAYLEKKGIYDAAEMTNADVVSYVMALKEEGKSGSTVNRKTASIRSFADFLVDEGLIARDKNPTEGVKPPKIEKHEIEFLSLEDINSIIEAPDDSVKGIRDRAILEVLYGTGIRVTELIEMKVSDVNFRIGFITCSGEFGKARIIPLGRPCREALERYMDRSRDKLIESHLNSIRHGDDKSENLKHIIEHGTVPAPEKTEDHLFINYHGEKFTRQGLWKIVRQYGEKAGLDVKLTPQIIRSSFAAHMIQNGADLKSIQELMGYEDPTTVQIYMNVTRNRIKEVYDKTHPRA